MLYTQEALGTLLSIQTKKTIPQNRIEHIFNTVFEFEKKYSRFIPGNFLSNLNETGKAKIDKEFETLLRLCIKMHAHSQGYFDITLLPILENLGYGISSSTLPLIGGVSSIEIEGTLVKLEKGTKLDLGGVGKGYLVDKIFSLLQEEDDDFIINFGGDIKVKGTHTIGLEDPLRMGKLIGKMLVKDISFCASSGEKRKFKDSHHLINPYTQKSQDDKIGVFTTHPLATIADIFATVLYVAPLEKAIEILNKTQGLEALIISKKGEIYKSVGMELELF